MMSGAEKRMQALARKKLQQATHGAERAASNAAKTIDDLREFRARVTPLRVSSRTTAEAAAMCRLLNKPPSGWDGLASKQAQTTCPAELTAAIGEVVALRACATASWLRRASHEAREVLPGLAPQDVMGNEQVVALRAALTAVRKRESGSSSMPLRGLWLGWHDLDVAEDSV